MGQCVILMQLEKGECVDEFVYKKAVVKVVNVSSSCR